MAFTAARRLPSDPSRAFIGSRFCAPVLARIAFAILVAGCHSIPPVDTKPLDTSGMSYDAIQELNSLKISTAEVSEVARMRQSGFSDADCVDVYKIYHARKLEFNAGEAIAGLVQADVSENTILQLANLNQLGLGAGELQAIKLAGLSDAILLEVARHRSEGKPVLAGASLANLKNAGVRESTLLELARRGVPDSQADAIISLRRHGASDAEILNRFPGA